MEDFRKIILLVTIFSFMSVGWGQFDTDNYTQEIIDISDDEVMIISNHEMEGYTFSDTSYISVSRLLPPCDDGYTEIDSSCYYQSDLNVLQIFIDNSDSTINMDMDVDSSGVIEPLELGTQNWDSGRLTNLDCSWYMESTRKCFNSYTNFPLSLGNLSELQYLSLKWNQVDGNIPESIGNLSNLVTLDLHYGTYQGLSGELPDSICNLTNLEYINIGYHSLSGNIPECIVNLTNLSNFTLNDNDIIGSLPENIGNMTSLNILNLNGNSLSGNIPESIGNLSNIEHIYISENEFDGVIPESISNLSSLSTFNIRNNLIGGVIPESICNLENLDFIGSGNSNWMFNISNNQLCPPYPECLSEWSIGEQDTSECVDCPDNIEGDVDGDGEVTILDIVLIVNCILSNDCDECSDWNFDESVDILDIILMINIILEP